MVSARLADRFSNHHEERSATIGPASREMPGTTVGKCFPYPDGRRRLSVVACFPTQQAPGRPLTRAPWRTSA